MELTDRIHELMRAKDWQPADVARVAGVSVSAVSQWLGAGSKPIKSIGRIDAAERLEAATGFRAQWIATGVGKKFTQGAAPAPIDIEGHPDWLPVRSVKLRLRCGVTGFAIDPGDEEGQPIFFRREWFDTRGYNPDKLLAIKVKDASMEPTLYDGDMVVINTADTEPKDGETFAVNYEGEPVVKRAFRDGGARWLHSDNADQRRYPRKECTENVILIGRVVHRQSERI